MIKIPKLEAREQDLANYSQILIKQIQDQRQDRKVMKIDQYNNILSKLQMQLIEEKKDVRILNDSERSENQKISFIQDEIEKKLEQSQQFQQKEINDNYQIIEAQIQELCEEVHEYKKKRKQEISSLKKQCFKKLQASKLKIQSTKSIHSQCDCTQKQTQIVDLKNVNAQLYLNKNQCKKKIKNKLQNIVLDYMLGQPQSHSISKTQKLKEQNSQRIKQVRHTLHKYKQFHNKQLSLLQNNLHQQVNIIKQKIQYGRNRRQMLQKQLITKVYLFQAQLSQLISQEENRYKKSFNNALSLMNKINNAFNTRQQELLEKQQPKCNNQAYIHTQKNIIGKNEQNHQQQNIQDQNIQKINLSNEIIKPQVMSYEYQSEKSKNTEKYEVSIQRYIQKSSLQPQDQKQLN